MNTTFPVSDNGNRVGSIGVSIGITLIIADISLVSYYCTRGHQPSRISNARTVRRDDSDRRLEVDVGLDEATISGFPKMLYSDDRPLAAIPPDVPGL